MNLYQTVQQIRHRLSLISWPGTRNKVFADESIIVTVGPEQNAMWQRRFPVVLIRPGASVADPVADEDPRFFQQNISLRLIQAVPGDDVGEMCILGAHQPELQPSEPLGGAAEAYDKSKTTSSGKGLLQIEEELLGELQSMGPDEGVFMLCRNKGGIDAVFDQEMGYVCWRDYQFETQVTSDRTFAPAINLKLTSTTLTWTKPGKRYDFRRMLLRFNSSSTPPATITAGTGISIAADAETATGATGKAYSLFAVYDDYHDTPSEDKDVSPAEILVT